MLLTHSVRYACRDYGELPDEARLAADIDKMISELKALRKAPEIKPCTVPAIFDPEMSSVLFHEALGHRLEGERQREEEEGKTFKGKIGEKILPEFLTLFDDPTMPNYKDKTLFGFYLYDDEAVQAQRVTLVEDGILRNYLMSRKPVEQFPKSNGHGRLCVNSESDFCSWREPSPIGRMANLEVRSKKQLPREQLEQQLIEECKKRGLDFGLIFVGSTGGHTSTNQYDYQAFLGRPKLVYKLNVNDRSRELVRGVNIVGTPLNTLENIIATGDDYDVFNGHCGAESGFIPVSGIAPSILLGEIEIQKSPEEKERPPLLPPPAVDQAVVAVTP
jgi:TldD protein